MIHNITKKIMCIDMLECADNIRTKLEQNLNLKLMARMRTDTINGYISIEHLPNNHKIHVCVYEKNESVNNKHLTTFKKPDKIPSKKQCENCLN